MQVYDWSKFLTALTVTCDWMQDKLCTPGCLKGTCGSTVDVVRLVTKSGQAMPFTSSFRPSGGDRGGGIPQSTMEM